MRENVQQLEQIPVTVTAVVLLLGIPSLTSGQTARNDHPLATTKGVVQLCERDESAFVIGCAAYISGFVAGTVAAQDAAVVEAIAPRVARGEITRTDAGVEREIEAYRRQISAFCIESTWTPAYVQAVIRQYALENPKSLDEPAADHMPKILAKAFPCSPR